MLDIRLSASAIGDYKACPTRYKLHDLYGLKLEKEKDSLRIGHNWHRCHEILGMIPQGKCPSCLKHEEIRDNCYLCDGKGVLPIDLMDSVVRFINYAYKDIPDNKTHDEWEVERIKMLYSLSAYRWYYGEEDDFEIVGEEIKFELPILNPQTRKKIGKAVFAGKIDELVRHKKTGLIYIRERKSTSKSLSDSTYWERLRIDDQITGYLYGIRRFQQAGGLEPYGISADDPLVEGIYYDVWHKPSIAPKALSQKDSKEFIESGIYCGEEFEVREDDLGMTGKAPVITVNNVPTIMTFGKKQGTFSIFETTEMYGARLIQDISERPEFYFEQRPIPRTDDQLVQFEQDLAKYVALIRYTDDHDLWWLNDRACENPFYCDFRNLCHGGTIIGPDDCPEGFKKYERNNSN